MFSDGHSFLVYPLKFVWILSEKRVPSLPIQIAFSVSKRNFKRAVKRNLIKRRMREAYRFNKNTLQQSLLIPENEMLSVMIVYVGKEVIPFEKIYSSMQKALDRLKLCVH